MLAPSQTVQDLQRARNLIADPAVWCKGPPKPKDTDHHCAITADLFVRGEFTSKWECVSPYLIQAATEMREELLEKAVSPTLVSKPGAYTIVYDVNDQLGHAAVMRMYDRAIQLAMAGG